MGERRVKAGAVALLTVLALLVGAAPAGAADADGDGVGDARDRCPTVPAARPDGCPLGRWKLRNTNSAGPVDVSFRFASIAGRPIAGDWDGDGDDTVGTFDPRTGRWRLVNSNGPGAPAPDLNYLGAILGLEIPAAVQPVVGDWDGDGDDTFGLMDTSTGEVALRNSNTAGPADITFSFGGSQPVRYVQVVAGDWDGDGDDTIGVFRRDTNRWRLRNDNSTGPPDLLFTFGRPGNADQPLVGDTDGGGGIDGIGVSLMEDEGIYWFFRTTPSPGPPETQFSWGDCAGCSSAVVGDWDGDGIDTAGFRR